MIHRVLFSVFLLIYLFGSWRSAQAADCSSHHACHTETSDAPPESLLTIHLFAFDNHPTDPSNLTPTYVNAIQSLIDETASDFRKIAFVLLDLDGEGDTQILRIQAGVVTPYVGLPVSGTLDPNLNEIDMTDGLALGDFIAWARNEVFGEVRTVVSFVGHGMALAPYDDLSMLSRSAIPLPTYIYVDPVYTDVHPRPAIITPRALQDALRIGTDDGNDPIDLLDLTHCFSASLEEFYQLANDGGTPYATVMTGSANYTYFSPDMPGAMLAQMSDTDSPTQLAAGLIAAYDDVLTMADFSDGDVAVEHPRTFVAVESARIPAIKQEMDALSAEILTNFDATAIHNAYLNAGSYYDTTFCTADWELAPPDALVDAGRFLEQLASIYPHATTVRNRIDEAILQTVASGGTPWFANTQPDWGWDSSDSGIALYADFEGRIVDNVYRLSWHASYYTHTVSAENPTIPYTFIEPPTDGVTWADVFARYWQTRPAAGKTIESLACLIDLPPARDLAELHVNTIVSPRTGSVHVGHDSRLAATMTTDRAVRNPLVTFTVRDAAQTVVFSDTVSTGYLMTGSHYVESKELWRPTSTGAFTLAATVDADNRFGEGDEEDNEVVQGVVVSAESPLIITATVASQILTTESVPLNITTNQPLDALHVQVYTFGLSHLLLEATLAYEQVVTDLTTLPTLDFPLLSGWQRGVFEIHLWGEANGVISANPVMLTANYLPETPILQTGTDVVMVGGFSADCLIFQLHSTVSVPKLSVWQPNNLWTAQELSGDGLIIVNPAPPGTYMLRIVGSSLDSAYTLTIDDTVSCGRQATYGMEQEESVVMVHPVPQLPTTGVPTAVQLQATTALPSSALAVIVGGVFSLVLTFLVVGKRRD